MTVGKYVIRAVALGYLLVILLGPLGMMIWRTFDDLDGAWGAITDHNTLLAFKLTLIVTAIAVPINTIFGVICGLVIVRGNFRGKGILNAFVDLPLALSPVVVGLSLILLYGANGWLGFLPEHGFQVLYAVPAIVLATIFVSLPFVAREVVPTLREIGDEQEQAAHTLGASGWQTFWRITLPSIRWAIVYGVVLTAARCLGEFGAVVVVSGNIEGKTQTATLRVDDAYQFAYGNYAPAYGISLVLAAMAIMVLVAMTVIKPREEAA
jgi:sulfate transport system permease protein